METINHECYVSLEVAKLLKEAGFDWKCKNLYDSQNNYNGITFTPLLKNWNVSNKLDYSAPTLNVAQRWLREVKDVEMYLMPFRHPEYDRTFYHVSICDVYGNIDEYPNSTMGSYEEEQEAGIKKALEIILEKDCVTDKEE